MRPSEETTARVCPSGAAVSSSTRPSRPAAIRRGGVSGPDRPGTAASSIASAPSASVIQASCPPWPSSTGSLVRTPGVSASTRAGPSRWASQYRLPRTVIALARPVVSQARSLT